MNKKTNIRDVLKFNLKDFHKIYVESKDIEIDLESTVSKNILNNLLIPGTYEYNVKNYLSEISYEYALSIADLLGIKFDFTFSESRYIDLCKYLIQWGLDNSHIKRDKYNRLVTHNGLVLTNSAQTPIYAFTDFATVVERFLYNVDRIYYVVDKRQHMHFNMLFDFVHESLTRDMILKHIKYGYVHDMGDNIMSSRHVAAESDVKDQILAFLNKGYSYQAIKVGFIFFETRHRIASDYIFVYRVLEECIHDASKFLEKIEIISNSINSPASEKNTLSALEKLIITKCIQIYEAVYMASEDQNLDRLGIVLQDIKKNILKLENQNISFTFCKIFVKFKILRQILE